MNKSSLLILLLLIFFTTSLSAEEEVEAVMYISVDPTIVTNYKPARKTSKMVFVQLKCQVSVRGKLAEDQVVLHMPLIRDFLVEYLGFMDESLLKDVTKRKEFRAGAVAGIQKLLTEHAGQPFVEDLVITHFMWN